MGQIYNKEQIEKFLTNFAIEEKLLAISDFNDFWQIARDKSIELYNGKVEVDLIYESVTYIKENYNNKEFWLEALKIITTKTLAKLNKILNDGFVKDYSGGKEYDRKLQPKELKDILATIKMIQEISKEGISEPQLREIVIKTVGRDEKRN